MHAQKKQAQHFFGLSHLSHTYGSDLVEQHLAAHSESTATRLFWFHKMKQFGDTDLKSVVHP